MLKSYILFTALLASSTIALASSPVDSIGVENNNGKKLIIHKVDAKESYYSLARRYNVNVKDLQSFNNNMGLQIGSIVKVPTAVPYLDNAVKALATTANNNQFFDYTVATKDNLNVIAERYATTIDEIKRLNNLSSINLKIGQTLKIPFTKSATSLQKKTNVPAVTVSTEAPAPSDKEGNVVVEHMVKPKEYLGIIAKQYGLTVDDLKKANNLSSINLHIGQVLKIPVKGISTSAVPPVEKPNVVATVNEPAVDTQKPVTAPKKTEPIAKNIEPATKVEPTFEHVVASGETIYAIAQKYKLTTYQLSNLNNLSSTELRVGQKLIIKGEKPAITETANNNNVEAETTETPETLKNPSLRRPAAVYGLNRVEERGTGTWISDPDLDPNKMLILHRSAPVGTIMQITNPMSNRSTFAKVVGKFTENDSTKDVIIVMTKAVADAIGALDKRFFCTLSYGPKDNEK